MDIVSIAKVAIELGIIPAIALFLIVSFHRQNVKLTQMLQEREKQSIELVRTFSEHILLIRDEKKG